MLSIMKMVKKYPKFSKEEVINLKNRFDRLSEFSDHIKKQ